MNTEYIKTLHTTYQNAIDSFRRDFPDKTLINYASIDEFVRSCA